MNIVFPPRPKGKMLPSDLYLYEDGNWLAQRKFNGSRVVVHISSERRITVGKMHGTTFSKFELSSKEKEDLISCLNLDAEK